MTSRKLIKKYYIDNLKEHEKEDVQHRQLLDAYAKLKKANDELKKDLDTLRLQNEIISAIGKTYHYISRIDIEDDYYEVVSGYENFPANVKRKDSFSKNVYVNCKNIVEGTYLEELMKFLDISTLADRLQNDETIAMDYRMQNGDWRKVRLVVKKRNEQGRVTHVLCAVRNISDEKMREYQLVTKTNEAKREAVEKTRFLANMSHDIRTPINGIVGMIDIAEQYPEDANLQRKCMNHIKKLSGCLVSIVNDVLDMNRLQADDFMVCNSVFDISEMLRMTNETSQAKAAEKNIEYVIDWEKSNMNHRYIVGNPIYTSRILTILADNAIKFSAAGSTINVWCTEKVVDEDTVMYTFVCKDRGIGMSKEFIERAFDMFAQEDETSRTRYEGTGLGLAIAKRLADKLHGTIRLESEKGVGTTASLEMPFKIGKADNAPSGAHYIRENISLDGMRVLVVEDNDLNMEIAKFILEDQGLITECATNGIEAVKMFEESEPGYYDAILIDIMMPGLNGLDATRKIRSMQRHDAGEIPIIAMSANALADDIIKSRLAGINEHLTKPLDGKKIMEAIKKCVCNRLA